MSVITENPGPETRSILAPTDNRVEAFEELRRKKETKKKKEHKKTDAAVVVGRKVSVDNSSSDSSSCCSGSAVKKSKTVGSRRRVVEDKSNGIDKTEKVVDRIENITISPVVPIPVKRCDWITPNSEPLYVSFHDEEWGLPIRDDNKLFELLVLSQALAELSWLVILSKREIFRKIFDDFNPSYVANLDEEKLLAMRVQGNNMLLSEAKLRAIVENAKQMIKIQQEFGSFSNYFWRFMNHKPIKSGFRYARQVPAKTPKSEVISKDLMKQGFRCVGPMVVYSFMQVSGMVNDHLLTCFRCNECSSRDAGEKATPDQLDKTQVLGEITLTPP